MPYGGQHDFALPVRNFLYALYFYTGCLTFGIIHNTVLEYHKKLQFIEGSQILLLLIV